MPSCKHTKYIGFPTIPDSDEDDDDDDDDEEEEEEEEDGEGEGRPAKRRRTGTLHTYMLTCIDTRTDKHLHTPTRIIAVL
jgi:TATA-binding protein-associated factor Taf7